MVLGLGEILERKYQVLAHRGEGGMGVVFEGQNLETGQRVAIKVMRSHLLAERDLVLRFEREALAAASIDSAHVVAVLDSGDLPNGHRYMVMELLVGESLHARLKRRGWLTPEEAAAIFVQLTLGLSRVHAAGIVHRDLKPHNIHLVPSQGLVDHVKILDFGACKLLTPVDGAPEIKTSVGNLFGTVPYMAPECFDAGPSGIDARADVYSTGVMLYRSVTGQLPFRASTVFEMIAHLRAGESVRLGDVMPGVDLKFCAIVDGAIALDPEKRSPSAEHLHDALRSWMKTSPRLRDVLAFLDDAAAARAAASEDEPKTEPRREPPGKVRDQLPTIHAEEEALRMAATIADPEDFASTSRIHREAAPMRETLRTIEEIPIDVVQEDSIRDVHDEMNTVEMQTILKSK